MKINEILIYIKKLSFTKIINVFKYFLSISYSYISRRPVRLNYPLSISVEPTNFCNLQCLQCPVGRGELTRQRGNINFDLYKKIIDQSAQYLLNLFLYFQGEPFLNKELFKMIEYANHKKIVTVTSTNGHFLTYENIEKIISSGLDILIISLDGTTQDIYEKYRVGGNIEKVIEGIKLLNELKQKKKVKHPFVDLQFIVLKSNENQINDFKKLAKKLKVDKYTLKTAQIYDYQNDSSLIPTQKKYSRYIKTDKGWQMKKKIKNKCNRLWNSSVITINGDVLPCCFDKNADFVFGNIKDENYGKIIQNQNFKKFAKRIMDDRKSIEMCNNCTE